MENNKKVIKIYNKILECRNNYMRPVYFGREASKIDSLIDSNYDIKVVLNTIIKLKRDYLLTEPYLYSIVLNSFNEDKAVFISNLYNELEILTGDNDILIIYSIMRYLDITCIFPSGIQKVNFGIMNARDMMANMSKSFGYEIENQVSSAMFRMYNMDHNLDQKKECVMRLALLAIGAYAFYKKNPDIVNIYFNKYNYFRDSESFFEELKLNGAWEWYMKDEELKIEEVRVNIRELIYCITNLENRKVKKIIT